jgi:hypothetical protein
LPFALAQEKEDLARFLLRIEHERGTAMLWVEHDMELSACRDPRVTEAYLGTAYVRKRGAARC